MLHFRSKAEIADLPVWTIDAVQAGGITQDFGVQRKMGDVPGLIGAFDIGSCFNIAQLKVDLWIHEFTTVLDENGDPTLGTHLAHDRIQRTFERGQFAFLAPVFDYPVFAHSYAQEVAKTYATEALRLADLTLTDKHVGLPFKQISPLTYWTLLRARTANTSGEWLQIKEPLPNPKAALIAMMGGGGIAGQVGSPPYFPASLFLGTSYIAGKFTGAQDPEFPTYLSQSMLASPAYDYDPPIHAPAVAPTNVMEQIGHTMKLHEVADSSQTFVVRFAMASPRFKRGSELVGQLLTSAFDTIFGLCDATNSRPYWPNGTHDGDFTFPSGPTAKEHNYSWFIDSHTWPAFEFYFPTAHHNDGHPFYYTPGTVNAGHEVLQLVDLGGHGKHDPWVENADGTGRNIDYQVITKFDMGKLAQEYDEEGEAAPDPTRYIRELNAGR